MREKKKIGITRHYYHSSTNVFFKSEKRHTESMLKVNFTANSQGSMFDPRSKFIWKNHTEYFVTPNN